MDRMTKEQRSRVMSKIRGTKTNFEIKVFRELRKRKLRFKTHYTRVMGKPDIALPKARKAVFLHSDFWHGWQLSRWENILPNEFWKEKLKRNRIRDRKVSAALRQSGWDVMVVWEHALKKDFNETLNEIAVFLMK